MSIQILCVNGTPTLSCTAQISNVCGVWNNGNIALHHTYAIWCQHQVAIGVGGFYGVVGYLDVAQQPDLRQKPGQSSLVSLKAVRSGSPVPSFGIAPMLITYWVIGGFSLFHYLWLNAGSKLCCALCNNHVILVLRCVKAVNYLER
jgi:hypothetical protein